MCDHPGNKSFNRLRRAFSSRVCAEASTTRNIQHKAQPEAWPLLLINQSNTDSINLVAWGHWMPCGNPYTFNTTQSIKFFPEIQNTNASLWPGWNAGVPVKFYPINQFLFSERHNSPHPSDCSFKLQDAMPQSINFRRYHYHGNPSLSFSNSIPNQSIRNLP